MYAVLALIFAMLLVDITSTAFQKSYMLLILRGISNDGKYLHVT